MNRISPKGVLIGGIVDITASTLVGVALSLYVGLSPALATVPPEGRAQAIEDLILHQPEFYITGLLVGSLCSVLGGYVAARIARHDEILNGALSSFLCVGLGIYELATSADGQTPVSQIVAFVVSPSLGALGGYLRDCQPRTHSTWAPAECN
jgi:hypothetical protein